MADFSSIRAGLATRVATISGLRVSAQVPEQVVPPAAFVAPESWTYHLAMGMPGLSQARFVVTLLVAPLQQSTYGRAQEKLDAYLDDTGALSIKAAIEGDRTLGGTVTTLSVLGVRDYGVLEWGEVPYVGALLDIDVWP